MKLKIDKLYQLISYIFYNVNPYLLFFSKHIKKKQYNDIFVINFLSKYFEIANMQKQYHNEALILDVINCIKALRKSQNVTLESFYFDTGIHLARIEQGKTNITISTLSKICNYFEISLVEFFIKACGNEKIKQI
jgi:DNA-binding Xre family transcriptional regulator